MIIPLLRDLSDYFAIRTKTITRIAIADIMNDKMLLEWYKKVLANMVCIDSLVGIGYFESEFSHGYIMASRFYNKRAIEIINYNLDKRNINLNKYNDITLLKAKIQK